MTKFFGKEYENIGTLHNPVYISLTKECSGPAAENTIVDLFSKSYIKTISGEENIYLAKKEPCLITAENIADTMMELHSSNQGVLSAGPLFGSTMTNTPGAYEIVLAPGYRLQGDTGNLWNRSRKYVIEVDNEGFSFAQHRKYLYQNLRSAEGNDTVHGISKADPVNQLSIEVNNSWANPSVVAEFNHPVRWGSASKGSSPDTNFIYTLPAKASNYRIVGGGGAGGTNNNNGDGGAGSGGDSGGIKTVSVVREAGEQITIAVGQGGFGALFYFNGGVSIPPNASAKDNAGNSLYNNYYSYGQGQAGTDSRCYLSNNYVATGGGGGISAFGGSAVAGPVASGQATGPGTPDGVAGGVPPWDSDNKQPGGNLRLENSIGNGGAGIWARYSGYGNDGAVWITLTT